MSYTLFHAITRYEALHPLLSLLSPVIDCLSSPLSDGRNLISGTYPYSSYSYKRTV
jgi:hypothetical protein